MSDLFRILRAAEPPAQGGGTPPSRRPGSVMLRAGTTSGGGDADLLDPANQSLADALRITLRLILFGMIVLAGLFLVSGSQSIRENERGVQLRFGAVVKGNVEPGLSINPPYPIGELVRVDVGLAELKIDDKFWIYAANKADLAKPLDQLSPTPNLTPGQGGSNLTADGNLAHTQWKAIYTRDSATDWAQNVLPEAEQDLVRTAVQRGIVQACAKVDLDDLLRQSGSDSGGVAARAKLVAQAQLDRAKSGIRLQKVLLENVVPPLIVRQFFNAVQGAVSQATKTVTVAESDAATVLTEQAGGSVEPLRALLAEYENAIEGRGTRPADAVLAQINAMILGESIEIDGKKVEGVTSGKVARIIAEARRYQSDIATRRRGEYERYRQKLQQLATSPELAVASEIAEAVRAFTTRKDLQAIFIPNGTEYIEINLNRDPDIAKEILTKLRQSEDDKNKIERERVLNEERFRPKDATTGAQ